MKKLFALLLTALLSVSAVSVSASDIGESKGDVPKIEAGIIQIDGQCNDGTFKVLAEAGVESFIVGTSGLFSRDPDLATAWDKMIAKFNEAVNG